MIFNAHSGLQGSHAFLSASKYHWINYSEEQLIDYMISRRAAAEGTELHELAAKLIEKRIKLPRNGLTMSRYVNDAIAFFMNPEQLLFVSIICFGTADAISFKEENGQMVLRIHDLKTGSTKTSFQQLILYAAFFCIEYEVIPGDIVVYLRIYQNDEFREYPLPTDELVHTIDRVTSINRFMLKKQEELAG